MAAKATRKQYPSRQCVYCSVTFEQKIYNQITCSPVCRLEHQRNVAREAQRQKRVFLPRPVKKFSNCVRCGTEFHKRRDDHVACSLKCRGILNRAVRPSRAVLSHSLAIEVRNCARCEKPFTPATYQQTFCCSTCKQKAGNKKALAKRPKKRNPEMRFTCPECSVIYCPRDKRQKYCTLLCSGKAFHRINTRVRRARIAKVIVEPVDPIVVFNRDGWKCQLCGVKTPKHLRGSRDNKAPELDHIVPVSKGGEHSYRNTQCACKSCNRSKGSKPLGQALLFG